MDEALPVDFRKMKITKLTVRIPTTTKQRLERERKQESRERGYKVTLQEIVIRKLNQ